MINNSKVCYVYTKEKYLYIYIYIYNTYGTVLYTKIDRSRAHDSE